MSQIVMKSVIDIIILINQMNFTALKLVQQNIIN